MSKKVVKKSRNCFPCPTSAEWRESKRIDPSDLEKYHSLADTNRKAVQE